MRRYELIMRDRFLVCRHQSVRLPQEKSPKGDQHEELGVFSFDTERKALVYREFMSEGVVVRSPCSGALLHEPLDARSAVGSLTPALTAAFREA